MFLNWNLDPIAISLFGFNIHWYGILFASGFLIGYFFVKKILEKQNIDSEKIIDNLLLYMFAGTVIGARLGHCFFYDPQFYLSNPLEIIKIWHGGLASHGGGIGLVISVLIFCKKYKLNFLPLADLLCIPTAFEGGMIRLGNFCNSEIYGKATNLNFGVIFERLGDSIPRHPVQLYESVSYFAISILLFILFKKFSQKLSGLILGLFLSLIFTIRILLESFKPEQASYVADSNSSFFTVGQYLSIPFIVVGILLVFFAIKNKKYQPIEK